MENNIAKRVIGKGKDFFDLNQIKEVSEEYSRHGKTRNDIEIKKTQCPILTKKQQSLKKLGMIKRASLCVKETYIKLCSKLTSTQIDIDESQMSQMLGKLKKKKHKIHLLPPKKKGNKKTLVLDLDETLIYAFFKPNKKYDFSIEIESNDKMVPVYIRKRFGLDSFLFEMSKHFEIIVFSSGKRQYVNSILKLIDPKQRISYSLSRQHCVIVNKYHYIKHLDALGRDLNNTILIDDNRMAGILNQQNFYQIKAFKGNEKDRELLKLSHFLNHIRQLNKIVPVSMHRKKYQSRQIDLQNKKKINEELFTEKYESQRSLNVNGEEETEIQMNGSEN